jgi:signal transduction histidine kinase
MEILTPAKKLLTVSHNLDMIYDSNEIPKHLILTQLNITKYKRKEKYLETNKQKINNALIKCKKKLSDTQRIARVGSWDWDIKSGKVEWTDETFEIMGVNKKEFRPTIERIMEWSTQKDRDRDVIEEIIRERRPIISEMTWKAPNTKEITFLVSSEGVFDDEENLVRIVGTSFDITAIKKAEKQILNHSIKLENANKELMKMNDKLTELDKLKTEFISTASHEIRTPLASIVGFSKTLLAKDIKLTQTNIDKYLNIINSESSRLGVLIDQMLDITRFETGALEMHYQKTNISDLIQDSIQSIIIPDDININFNLSKQITAKLDSAKIKQVIINLLDNAIRYSDPGSAITILASETKNTVKISIKDTGLGISKEELPEIFSSFYRGKTSVSKRYKGSGLGLAISKTLIEAHNGKIWTESEPGKGSVFYFTIPKKSH